MIVYNFDMKYIVLTLVLISSLIYPSFAYEEELFGDEIFIEPEKIQLNLNKSLPSVYRQVYEKEKTGIEYKKGKVSLFSGSSKSLNDYMVEDYKSTTGAVLNPGGRLSLSGGMEVKYQNPNASINSKKYYFTPSLRLNDDISLTFANKFNHDSRVYENEVGIQYSPKFFKAGKFGVTAGTVFDEDIIKSQNLKFSTDLFIF